MGRFNHGSVLSHHLPIAFNQSHNDYHEDAVGLRTSPPPWPACTAIQNWASHSQSAALLIGLSLDFLALSLNVIKVVIFNRGRRSHLVNTLLQDGIIYFGVS